jgi:hypothetical protein
MKVRTSLLLSCTALLLLGPAPTRAAGPGAETAKASQPGPITPQMSLLRCPAPTTIPDLAEQRPRPLFNTTCNTCSDPNCVGQTIGGTCAGGHGGTCMVDHKCSSDTGWACVCGPF